MSQAFADKAAAKGAAYLDKKLPAWEFDINLRTLDLAEGCQCVLGQLACDIIPRETWAPKLIRGLSKPFFSEAVSALRLSEKRRRSLGFVNTHIPWTSLGGYDEDAGCHYHELTTAWKAIVKARRKAAKVAA